jgi:hypothetical protein
MRYAAVVVFPEIITAMNWFKSFWKALNQPASLHSAPEVSLNNFTPRAERVLALSRMEADRFHHNFVGTEHLLLGLIAVNQGVAVNVLRKLGLDLEIVRREVEQQVGTGPDQKLISNIPYTPRVKKVLALADKERKALNHTYLGTEHILLGLLREGDGVAARVLANLQVNIEETRMEILKELDPNFDPGENETKHLPVEETIPTPPQLKIPEMVTLPKAQAEPIDLTKRYDVYCSELNPDIVVHRNVLFKGLRRLFRENHDSESDFIELEQADGQTIFVAKYSVIKFCAPGATPNAEKVPGQQP